MGGEVSGRTDWRVVHGDCLDLLPSVEAENVDLVYLDPPFNTGKTWTNKTSGVALSFEDRFPSLASYVSYMENRCRELHRVLKPTGSLWLHQDPHHGISYLKIMLDEVFGIENFHAEIVWKRKDGGTSKKAFVRAHDSILVYGKTGAAETRPECNDADPCACTGMWLDISGGRSFGKEYVGYPTQKPEKLLERIVRAGSKSGELVLDPFMGSGTTGAAALKAGRRFVGMDQSGDAVRVASERLSGIRPPDLSLFEVA